MEYVIIALLFLVVVYFVWVWVVHILQTKKYSLGYGWGGYRKFKERFRQTNWERIRWEGIKQYEVSSSENFHTIHEVADGVIKFYNVGMVMRTPIDYLLATHYAHKYIRKCLRPQYIKYKWQ